LDELYKQEILELTELLKNNPEWEDLRNVLSKKGINIKCVALVSFIEDEEENEYGILVSKDIKVIQYLRTTKYGDNNFSIIDITNNKYEISKYPQIHIATPLYKFFVKKNNVQDTLLYNELAKTHYKGK